MLEASGRRERSTIPVEHDVNGTPRQSGVPVRRYAAFLRGVSPMNLRMADLKRCLEEEGFTDVCTLLSSGNVVFSVENVPARAVETRIESALRQRLGREFPTLVRSKEYLGKLINSDPYARFGLSNKHKRVVTFLRNVPKPRVALPLPVDGSRILDVARREVFSAYTPSPRGAVFMTLIEKTFGKDITTRTWDTVLKVLSALNQRSRFGSKPANLENPRRISRKHLPLI